MTQNQNYRALPSYEFIPIIKIVKWTYLPYLMLQFLIFLDTLVKYPTNLLEATGIFIAMSGWGYLIIASPFMLIGAGIEYFLRQTRLDHIPIDTTLYEAITQPTIMLGTIKIIVPKSSRENDIMEET
ncbi:hypothetical protein CEE45_17730 [Candidatus Heimdallarchaeota archaeon B3_Heim]|nr:MAG: hypothetical protein CEE45_17730 [Candidatus Heimdallarchaeota archaeon B3_Heim]